MAHLDPEWLFNSLGSGMTAIEPGASKPRNEEIPRRTELGLQYRQGALGGDVRTFPYTDLIREHLAQGRIIEAKNLLAFARDLIPADSKLLKVLAPPRIKKSNQPSVDRTNEFRWLRENSAKYHGQWVALTGDGLFASAATLADLLAELRASPPPVEPLIHHLI